MSSELLAAAMTATVGDPVRPEEDALSPARARVELSIFVFEEGGRAASSGASTLLASPAGGKVSDSTFRSTCAIWSLADGTGVDPDAVLSVRVLAPFETGSRWGSGIGEEGWAMTSRFCDASTFPPDAVAGFDGVFSGVLAGAFDSDSATGLTGFTGGKSFVGLGAGAFARAAASAAAELP